MPLKACSTILSKEPVQFGKKPGVWLECGYSAAITRANILKNVAYLPVGLNQLTLLSTN